MLMFLQIAELPEGQYFQLFKMFVDGFSAALMACKGGYVQGTPAADRLDRLCFESGTSSRAVLHNHRTRARCGFRGVP